MKIIAIDAGNTHLRFANVDVDNLADNPLFVEIIHSDYDSIFTKLDENLPISISSVVPKGKELYEKLQKLGRKVYFCERKTIANLTINYSETLGIDRIVDAVAGLKLFPNRDLIIIDSGTATTVDCVSADGIFWGGFILPGIKITSEAIHEKTAVLPKLNPFELEFNEMPQDTVSAVASGLIADCAGGIEYAIDFCERKFASTASTSSATNQLPLILGCGGGWEIIKKFVRKPTLSVPALTLIGTAVAAEDKFR